MIQVSRTSIDFGFVSYLQQKTETFTISNSTPLVPIVVSSITFNNANFSISEIFPFTITSTPKLIYVTFVANNLTLQTCDLSINSDDITTPIVIIPLTATVQQPEIVVSPISLDFGITTVAQPKYLNSIISNYDLGTLYVNVSSSNPLFVPNQTTLQIASSSNSSLSITFSPVSTGVQSAVITLSTNDPDHPIVFINVTGQGKNSNIAVDSNSIDFGMIGIYDSKQEYIKISCVGTVDLVVSDILVSNSTFSISSTSFTVIPGNEQLLTVTFNPQGISQYSGILTIKSNSSSGDFLISLSGESESAAIYVNRTAINFGNVTIHDSKTENIIVSNMSSDFIDLLLISVTTTNPVFKETVNTFKVHKGNALQIPITFTPVNIAPQTGQLLIESNDTSLPIASVNLLGTGIIAPNIRTSTKLISFGDVAVGQTITKTFQISNSGISVLNVANISTNNIKFVVVPISKIINPNSSSDFQVSFSPTDTSNIIAKIAISSNDPDSPITYIDLQGRGLSSSIEVVPSSLDFANVTIGESKEIIFKINNKSPVPLVITNIVSNNLLFTINETMFPIVIQTQKSIGLTFTPENVGLELSTIQISSNDLNHPVVNIDARGSGVIPNISINPTSIDFFNVAIGQALSLNVNIYNLGQGTLVVDNVTSTDPVFSVDSTSFSIEPMQSKTVIVTFSPTVMGTKNSTIHFINNDPDSPDITLLVNGYGAFPVVSVAPESLDFGATVINSSKEQSLTISNSGRANLIVSISSSIPQYSVSPLNMTVQPDTSDTIKVTFSPTLVNSYPSIITLLTNDPVQSSIPISVIGSGISAPKIVVTPITLNFSEVYMGRTKQLPITVSNQGTQLLTFSTSLDNPIRPLRPAAFTVSPTSGSISVSGQTTLTVVFRPSDPESLSGTLKIASNDLSEPLVNVSLLGTGKPAILEWDKINTSSWIPREIRTIANAVSTVVDPLVTALDLTTQVLNVIKMFIVNIDDPMKILLDQIKKLIEDFIKDLSATGLYMLYVLPGKAGVNPLTYPQYFRDLSKSDFNIFDPNNPSWFDGVKGGYSSFISKVVDSFDDPGDGNRPQFSSSAMVGAYVMMFDSGTIGPDDIAKFLKAIQKLMRMFRSPFKVAFEPPSNVCTFAGNKLIRVTFTPSVSVLPKEYFIFRCETQGGDVVTDINGNEYKDEVGKVIRTWKLVGITNVAQQLAKIMGVGEQQAKTILGEVGYAAKSLSKTFLSGDAFRFLFEDKTVENGKTYYYVVAAGYTTQDIGSSGDYNTIITHNRSTPIYLKGKNPDSTGVYTADFDKKLNANLVEENIIPISETKILAIGGLSAEVSAKPVDVVFDVLGGLARCRNFRCGFDIDETEFFDIVEVPEFFSLSKSPIGGSVKIKIKRDDKEFTASQSTYRVDIKSSKIYVRSYYYFKPKDTLTITYKYRKDLQTKEARETGRLGSDLTFLTKNKPIDSTSVEVYLMDETRVPSSEVTVLNDKDGRIKVKKNPGTLLEFRYRYFSDFTESDFFKCIRSEYSRYFFDVAKCDGGSTLCPGYDNANCYYNTGSSCTNKELSQRRVLKLGLFEPELTPFSAFWDPVCCQNSTMKQRCDGYSKTIQRYSQKVWPDWSSVQLSAIGMFPKIEEIMKVMENLIDSLLAGTEKMDKATTAFIDLLQQKIDSLRRFIELINSFIQIIVEDFALPDLYFLNIPYASGGNEYLKTSIKNAVNGPISDPTAYTAGVVMAYGTPGLGNALKLFFGD